MKPRLGLKWAVLFFLLLSIQRGAAQFVELMAEIQIDDWDYTFFQAEHRRQPPETQKSIFNKAYSVRCVVGTNTWMIEGEFITNGKKTYWFTGSNIVAHTVITKQLPDPPKLANFPVMNSPQVGAKFTDTYESADGNPGRPVRVSDLMMLRENIVWLAFCSGSALKQDGRKINPPSSSWKEIGRVATSDKTKVFEDALGLPMSVKLLTKEQDMAFQYEVHQTTNVSGWSFPLEFYCVQYESVRTNQGNLRLTAKGRLTSIKERTDLGISTEIQKNKE